MTYTFCEVINGEITKYNISRPRRWGNISFGTGATDAEYISANLYPVVGDAPAYDQVTQRLDGPTYTVNGQQVDRIYTIASLTQEEIFKRASEPLETALENMLDTKARERTWKDCMSARAAAGYPSSFQPEGIAFVNWWAACWEKAHQIMAECIAGTRPIPTTEEFLTEMPGLVLP